MKAKNISHYNNGTFRGYRVTIMSHGAMYCKYISHRNYQNKEETLQAAIRCRDWIRAALLKRMNDTTIRENLKLKQF